MKVMVIDDNAAVRSSLKLVLQGEFDEVLALGDPRLIPAVLSGGKVDAVLLDMNFDVGNLDGKEGIFWLKRIKESPCPPAVVMITAFGDVPLAVEAMKEGAEDFVTKPWDNEELIDKIKRAIHRNVHAKDESLQISRASMLEERERQRLTMTLDELKFEHVSEIVRQNDGNLSASAKQLGINRQTLYNILKKK